MVNDADLLFPREVIPSYLQDRLGSDLEIRPLAASDYSRGHVELLSVLTVAPQLSQQEYSERFSYMKSCLNTYFTVVIVNKATDKIVSCGTVFVERKFIRGAGLAGHIEDIAVSKTMQGRKLGIQLIKSLEEIARSQGCYKVILDCSKDNVAFYEKCGFFHKECEMALYMDQPSTTTLASRL